MKSCHDQTADVVLLERPSEDEEPLPRLSRRQSRLYQTASEIYDEPNPDPQDHAFLGRQLVQVTLPHANPGSVPAWRRTNGNLTLSIRPGWDGVHNCSLGYPYGTIPRLLLFWMTTETLRTRSRKLELGESLAAYMRKLGLNPGNGTGKRSDARRLRNQMERFFQATISFQQTEEDEGQLQGKRWLNMQVAPEGELWWDPKRPEQTTIFGSWIELGEKFYEAISSAAVPLDLRAIRALKSSSLALDLYAWTSYRTYRVSRAGSSQFIPWRALQKQLGTDYNDPKNFKRKAKAALHDVELVYPELRVAYEPGGIRLYPSRPAVLAKS